MVRDVVWYGVWGSRIVVPTAMRREILDWLHSGHQGINKCRCWAQQTIWYVARNVESTDGNCQWLWRMQETSHSAHTDWTTAVAMALFNSLTSEEVVAHWKLIFSQFRIPEQVVSENGSQLASAVFQKFAQSYALIMLQLSGPYYPTGNRVLREWSKLSRVSLARKKIHT